VGMTKPVIR